MTYNSAISQGWRKECRKCAWEVRRCDWTCRRQGRSTSLVDDSAFYDQDQVSSGRKKGGQSGHTPGQYGACAIPLPSVGVASSSKSLGLFRNSRSFAVSASEGAGGDESSLEAELFEWVESVDDGARRSLTRRLTSADGVTIRSPRTNGVSEYR